MYRDSAPVLGDFLNLIPAVNDRLGFACVYREYFADDIGYAGTFVLDFDRTQITECHLIHLPEDII